MTVLTLESLHELIEDMQSEINELNHKVDHLENEMYQVTKET